MIYLGQNDFSTERQPMRDPFKRNYKRLIKAIKDYYGEDHPILCVSTKVDKLLFDFVRECVEECGYKNVYYDGMFQAVRGSFRRKKRRWRWFTATSAGWMP